MNRLSQLERIAVWILETAASQYERDALIGDILERYRERRSVPWLFRDMSTAVGLGIAQRIRRYGLQFATALLAAWTIHVGMHVASLGVARRVSVSMHDLALRGASVWDLGRAAALTIAGAAGAIAFGGWVFAIAALCGHTIVRIHHEHRRLAIAVFAAYAAYPGAATALQQFSSYLEAPRVGWDPIPTLHQVVYASAAIIGTLWGARPRWRPQT